jgi:hypothetical protein
MQNRQWRLGIGVAVMLAVSGVFGMRTIAAPMILGSVDIPSDGSDVLANEFYVAGWVFRCDTGAAPDAVGMAFFNRDTGQWFFPSAWILSDQVYRPDVRAALKDGCPTVGDYTGYHLYPEPPPPGQWDMYVSWATYDGAQWTDRRAVTIARPWAPYREGTTSYGRTVR